LEKNGRRRKVQTINNRDMDRIDELMIKLGENDFTLIKDFGKLEHIEEHLKVVNEEWEESIKVHYVKEWIERRKEEVLKSIKDNSENIDY
jgi:hypothetical protein